MTAPPSAPDLVRYEVWWSPNGLNPKSSPTGCYVLYIDVRAEIERLTRERDEWKEIADRASVATSAWIGKHERLRAALETARANLQDWIINPYAGGYSTWDFYGHCQKIRDNLSEALRGAGLSPDWSTATIKGAGEK